MLNKKALKERWQSICYWTVNLAVAILTTVLPKGVGILFFNQMENLGGMWEWLSWGIICALIGLYIFWCIKVLVEDIKIIFCKTDDANGTGDVLRNLPVSESLPKAESLFLQRLITTRNKAQQIAVAIVLKDFIKERNLSICHNELCDYIPTHRHIIKDTEKSLHSLVSAISLMPKYESDKYYNSTLVMSIGMEII